VNGVKKMADTTAALLEKAFSPWWRLIPLNDEPERQAAQQAARRLRHEAGSLRQELEALERVLRR